VLNARWWLNETKKEIPTPASDSNERKKEIPTPASAATPEQYHKLFVIQHCFICRSQFSTEDAGVKPTTVTTSSLVDAPFNVRKQLTSDASLTTI
jgi:hypothetical protein